MTWHEPLTGLDTLFLDLEGPCVQMHVGGVCTYRGRAPPERELVARVAAWLDRAPRLRQRLAFGAPGLARPAWVDVPAVDLGAHVHRVTLAPHGRAALGRLAARVFAAPLDRGRPLWELWLVDGVARDRFAIIVKVHHCVLDGRSGVELVAALHDGSPAPDAAPPGPAPRAAPGALALTAASLRDQLARPLALAGGALRPGSALLELCAGALPLAAIGAMGAAPARALDARLGPRRRWEALELDLGEVRRIRAALGGTVNDVLLAALAGALRRLLQRRGARVPAALRAFVPVDVCPPEERARLGNQVAALFCPLPVGEADAVARLRRVSAEEDRAKRWNVLGTRALLHLRELAPPWLARAAARADPVTRWFDVVVTNVRGPTAPLHLLGRRLLTWHPQVPLAQHQSLGIAILSYDGALGIGLLGDADGAPDLAFLARALQEEVAELAARAAAVHGPARRAATR